MQDKNSNKNQYQDERYFRTTSFYTTVYLICKGCELIDVDKTQDPKRAQFVLLNTEKLDLLVNVFNFAKDQEPDLQVNMRDVITNIKNLKTLLYQQEE